MKGTQRSTTQIAFIVVGTLIVVFCIFIAMLVLRRAPPPPSLAEIHAHWKQTITSDAESLLSGTPSVAEITAVKDKILALTVAPQDRDAHLAIVMALLAMERNEPNAKGELSAAINTALWNQTQ